MKTIALATIAAAVATSAAAAPLPKPPSFAICGVCHKVGAGQAPTVGPNLWGVGNRKSGSTKFNYSAAMKASNLKWDRATLLKYVAAPQAVVPGTKMAYAGQKDPKQAAAIVDYLLSLK